MIEIDIKRAEVLADGYDSYGKLGKDQPFLFVSNDLATYNDDFTTWFCVFSSDGTLYGFDWTRDRDQSFRDLNDDPVRCLEVEIDPSPRYRIKNNG